MRLQTTASDLDPDELLARYRAERRPSDLAALFDSAAPDLFRLALRLCPDAATAEDVLQETFVAVIEHADAWDPQRRAMPWLTGILKNASRMSRRRAARCPDPSRVPHAEPHDDPALGVADAEERRLVQEAMDDLPEPLRGAALLRWRYGLEPAEIAHVKGVPPGTVRSWLHRALKSLRVEVGALPALLLLFRPERGLGGVRAAVVRRGAAWSDAARPGAVVAATTPGLVLGGMLVGKKLLAACVALVVLLAAGWLATRSRAAPQGEPTSLHDQQSSVVAPTRPARNAVRVNTDPARSDAGAAASDLAAEVRGTVAREDGTPVDGAEIEAVRDPWARMQDRPGRMEEENESCGSTRSAGDGSFRLPLRRGALVSLRASKDGFAQAEVVDAQAGDDVHVVLAPGVRLELDVCDEGGAALSALDVELGRTTEDGTARILRRVRSDDTGRVVVDGLPARGQIWIAPTRLGPADPNLLLLPASGEAHRDVVVRPGQRIRGRITDAATGQPVAGARVGVDWNLFGAVLSGADGTYALNAVRPLNGVKSLHVIADGFARAVSQLTDTDSTIDLSLYRGFRLRGRVVGAGGAPLPDACVSLWANTNVGSAWHFSIGQARAGSDGRFEIRGLDKLVDHSLIAAADGAGRARRTVSAPGPDAEDVDLGDVALPAACSLEGTIQDADVRLLARREVLLVGPVAMGTSGPSGAGRESRWSDPMGRFRFTDLEAGQYRLSAGVPGEAEASMELVVAPGEDVHGVVLRAGPSRTLDVRVTDDAGSPVPGALVVAATASRDAGSAISGLDGVARLTTSAAELEIRYAGVWERVAKREYLPTPPVKVPAGGAAEVALTLRWGAEVSGTVLDPDGAPVRAVCVRTDGSDSQSLGGWTDASGRFRIVVARAGSVDVVVDGVANVNGGSQDLLLEGRADAVTPGTSGLVIHCTRVATGRSLVVLVTAPDGAPAEHVTVDARCAATSQHVSAETGADGRATFRDLTARSFLLTARGKDAWLPSRSRGEAVVPSGQVVTLVLRRSARICGTVVTGEGRPAPRVSVTVGADEDLGFPGWGATADDRGDFVLLVPEEAREAFSLQAFGVIDGHQVRGTVGEARAGDTGVRLVVR